MYSPVNVEYCGLHGFVQKFDIIYRVMQVKYMCMLIHGV